MKKNIFLLIAFFCAISMAISQNRTIDEANALIAQQKYLSAYTLLNNSDPNNIDPEIAMAKSNLVLNFYITTDMHKDFSLKNLALNQNLADFRGMNITLPMVSFNPEMVLSNLSTLHPTNYKLRRALGNYYYEVHLSYPNNTWTEPDSVILDKMKENYLIAYKYNEYDYWSLFGIGYACLLDGEDEDAVKYLEKSVELNPDYALSYHDLAYAYCNLKNTEKSLEFAKKAYEMQDIPIYKAGAALLIGQIYENLEENDKALEYYRLSNKIAPNDFNTLVPLLSLEIKLDKPERKKRTEELFNIDPENPVVYQEIYKIYSENEKEKEFVDFMNAQRNNYRNKILIQANICFYMAIAQYEDDEWVNAKINFEKARTLFRNIYTSDHNVFKVIDSYTNVIKKK